MRSFIFITAAAIVLTACTQKKEETAKVNRERDSLISVINERENSINNFLAVNTEIENNLDSIAVREGAITIKMLKRAELNPSMKDRLNADIAAINNLMKDNRKKVNELNSKLKKSNVQLAEYDKMIKQLNSRVSDKDFDLMALNDEISSLNMQVERLETSVNILRAENTAQTQTIEEQANALHTAYYIVGSTKELHEKKIIDKSGGLLGIGRTSKIDPNMDNSQFVRIDYTKTNNIDFHSSKIRIVTAHPADSYTLTKENDNKANLNIKDPEKFWSISKYLVITTD
jgi:peptidoglycan hydrolase CwlO-like protein